MELMENGWSLWLVMLADCAWEFAPGSEHTQEQTPEIDF